MKCHRCETPAVRFFLRHFASWICLHYCEQCWAAGKAPKDWEEISADEALVFEVVEE